MDVRHGARCQPRFPKRPRSSAHCGLLGARANHGQAPGRALRSFLPGVASTKWRPASVRLTRIISGMMRARFSLRSLWPPSHANPSVPANFDGIVRVAWRKIRWLVMRRPKLSAEEHLSARSPAKRPRFLCCKQMAMACAIAPRACCGLPDDYPAKKAAMKLFEPLGSGATSRVKWLATT